MAGRVSAYDDLLEAMDAERIRAASVAEDSTHITIGLGRERDVAKQGLFAPRIAEVTVPKRGLNPEVTAKAVRAFLNAYEAAWAADPYLKALDDAA